MKYLKTITEIKPGIIQASGVDMENDKLNWKKELFTNPDIKENNILCMFKSSKNNTSKIKQLITTAHFINRKLMIGDRSCIILAYLLKVLNLAESINLIIVRKDVDKSNYNIANYFWDNTNFGVGVHIVSPDKLLEDISKDIQLIDTSSNLHRIYLFQDFTWSEIILLFRLSGIVLHGGDPVRRHALTYNQIILSEFVILLGLMKDYFIDRKGLILNKRYKLEERDYDLKKLRNLSKELYGTSYLDFRDERFKEIMRGNINTQDQNLSTVIDQFDEFLIDRDDYLKYKEAQKLAAVDQLGDVHQEEYKDTDSSLPTDTKVEDLKTNTSSNTSSSLYYNGKKSSSSQKREYHSSTLRSDSIKESETKDITLPAKNNKDNYIISYLDSVKNIIDQSNLSPVEAQRLIETSWVNLLTVKLDDPKHIINSHNYALIGSIKSANKSLKLYSETNRLKKRFPLFYKDLNKIENLMITFTLVLTFYSRLGYTAISSIVGNQILFQIFKNNYEHIQALHLQNIKYLPTSKDSFNEDSAQVAKTENHHISFGQYKSALNLESSDIIKLGDFFISIFSEIPSNLFEREYNKRSFYSSEMPDLAYIKINPEYLDIVKDNISIHPQSLPMLCEPGKWGDTSYGGFLENRIQGVDLITGSNRHSHKVENKENLYKAVNTISSVKFGVNSLLLNYLTNEGKYLLLSDKLDSSEKFQREITLKVAHSFSNVPFYLNTHADWRGRIYTKSFFISYQGGDLSSSLLNFWEGEPLTESGKSFLYIYGANIYNENNISKKSYNERIQWVKDHYDQIINLDPEFILRADKKFIFTSFCLIMKELHANPNFNVKLPVFLDATCSGIQHLAALMRDLELGSKVNLIPQTDSDIVGDIYSNIMEPLNKAINRFGLNNIEYASLSLVKFNRKIIKTSIMTKVYNVTNYGIAQQLKANLIAKKGDTEGAKSLFICPGINGNVYLTPNEILKIAQIINEQVFIIFPSLNDIYSYLIDITKLMIKLDIPVNWITPAGLKITQHYLKSKKTTIGIQFAGKVKTMILREWTDMLDKQKQTQAIIPNIIHSLDANHLINLINKAADEDFGPVISVHDCFGTHPNKMGRLEHMVKKEFILLYTQDNFLTKFHNRIIESMKDNNFTVETDGNNEYTYVISNDNIYKIPKAPKLGKLDLQKIIDSKYMIT